MVIRRQCPVRLVLHKSAMQSVYACMNIMNINQQNFAFKFENPPFIFLSTPLWLVSDGLKLSQGRFAFSFRTIFVLVWHIYIRVVRLHPDYWMCGLQLVYTTEPFWNGFHGTILDRSRMVLTPVYTVQSKLVSYVPFLINYQHVTKTRLFQWKNTQSVGSIHRTYFNVVGVRSIDRWIS